jgi:hypothetical protein
MIRPAFRFTPLSRSRRVSIHRCKARDRLLCCCPASATRHDATAAPETAVPLSLYTSLHFHSEATLVHPATYGWIAVTPPPSQSTAKPIKELNRSHASLPGGDIDLDGYALMRNRDQRKMFVNSTRVSLTFRQTRPRHPRMQAGRPRLAA